MSVRSGLMSATYVLRGSRPRQIGKIITFLRENHPEMCCRCARILIARAIRTGWLFQLVSKRTGEIVGVVGYDEGKSSKDAGYGQLAPFVLAPSAHRDGLGPWLLRFLLLYRRMLDHVLPLFAAPGTMPADQRGTLADTGFAPCDPKEIPPALARWAPSVLSILRHDHRWLPDLAAAVAGFAGSWRAPDGTTVRLDLGDLLPMEARGRLEDAAPDPWQVAWGEGEFCRCQG